MSTSEMREAMERMGPDESAFFRELLKKGEQREARVFLDLFHYFPGVHFAADENGK